MYLPLAPKAKGTCSHRVEGGKNSQATKREPRAESLSWAEETVDLSLFAAPRTDADGRALPCSNGGIHPPAHREVSLVSISSRASNGPGFRLDQAVCVSLA